MKKFEEFKNNKVNEDAFENNINQMTELIEFHGFNKSMLMYLNKFYVDYNSAFDNERNIFNINSVGISKNSPERQLAIELLSDLDLDENSDSVDLEGALINAFKKYLPR